MHGEHDGLMVAALSLGARHRPSGLNSRFIGRDLSFAEYVAASRAMLTRARTALGISDINRIVDGNSPFEFAPVAGAAPGKGRTFRRGVLLIHGLSDSPYFMRQLGTFFQQSGFRVMAILLPGHGTQPGDLLDISWQEWDKAVAYGVDRLAEEADEVYLAGYSAGAALSVHRSLNDERVRGLFLFSPALKVSSRAAYANLHRLYSWLMPSAKWVHIKPDLDLYKYESFPKNAAAQMYALTATVESTLKKREVHIPVFAAASEDDVTASTAATLDFMSNGRRSPSRLVLYTTDPARQLPRVPVERLELVNSSIPEHRILSFAHTSIILPPDDPYYGVAGEYSNGIHYYPGDMAKYQACNDRPGEVLQGEITEANLGAGTIRRLMYNPNFEALKASMRQFIDSLP